jgi:hypothetical protein
MSNLIAKINGLKLRLEAYAPLRTFCTTNFNKELTVKKVFKHRTEIQLNEFPLVLITRPQRQYEFAGEVARKKNIVYLYAGFRQEDREKALENSIEFEDLLEEAVNTRATGDVPMAVSATDSANDEGMFHPVYFLVKHVVIKDR